MGTITVAEMKQRIGVETVSGWVEITQAMIDTFADATGDHQFIHVDPARAALTPFGGTVAHGFLTLSLITLLRCRVPDAPEIAGAIFWANYGGAKVRFPTPVHSGARVRGRFKLLAFDEKSPGRFEHVDTVTVEIEGCDKPALVAQWIHQVFVQP